MTARVIRRFAYSAAGVVILMVASGAFLVWAALVAVNDDCALGDECITEVQR